MSNPSKEFHRPDNWPKAHQLLNRSDVHTVPYTISPRPTALNDYDADAFIDLEKLQSSYIQIKDDGRVHIGALTTLQELYLSELLKNMAGGVLNEAAYLSATLGLRNLATIAGTIINPENPPDVPLVLDGHGCCCHRAAGAGSDPPGGNGGLDEGLRQRASAG